MSTRYTCRHHGADETTHSDLSLRVCGCDGAVHHACAPRPALVGTVRPADWPVYLAWRTEADVMQEEAASPADYMARVRKLTERREADYAAHFDGCPDCPSAPDGECARAQELFRAWDAARELPAFRCLPGQDQSQER